MSEQMEVGHPTGLEHTSIKDKLEALKARKGALSREMMAARERGDTAGAERLLADIKAVSDDMKGLKKALKPTVSENQAEPSGMAEDTPAPAALDAPPLQDNTFERIVANPQDPQLIKAWDAFVRAHPQGSVYHLWQTRQVIERAFGHNTHYLCALDKGGSLIGLLPLVELSSRLFGHFVVSVPFFNYGGVLANNQETAKALIDEARQWSTSVGARHVELRHLTDSGLGLPARTDKVSFWLDLPEDPDILWKSFKPKIRAQVRRPESEAPVIKFGGAELLDHFYQVFAINMRDLGTPVYSKHFFKAFLEGMGKQATVAVVYLDHRPVGGAILLGYEGQLEIPWASTRREVNKLGINMWMYWQILHFAITHNYRRFDFGRCSQESGTYKFKQQWGAKPVQLVWEYLLNGEEALPQLNPHNPKFRLLVAVWQRLPVWLTRILGPGIVKNLP